MKIQPVSWLQTQMQSDIFTQKWQKFFTWIGRSISRWIMPKIDEKYLQRLLEGLTPTFKTRAGSSHKLSIVSG